MNSNHHLPTFNPLEKFNSISERLAEDERNTNLDEAIISWCIELSLEKHFPQVSKEIITNKNLWLQQKIVLKNLLQLYRNLLVITDKRIMRGTGNLFKRLENISDRDFWHNIQEVKQEMNIKSVVFVAFVFTGIGVLLYLLNKNDNKNSIRANVRSNTYHEHTSALEEKYILALLIKSDRYQKLIYSLKENNRLKPENSSKLYGATQGLWIGAKSKFDKSQIKQELINSNPVTATSEYDVHFVTIKLDEDDSRFYPDVNQMDRRDAFIELAKKSPQITVSPRLSCKAYEYTEFYSR